MASVPNMRLGPSVPPSGGGSPAEGDVGDLFAQLLLSTPILDGSTEVLPEAGVADDSAESAIDAVWTERPEGEEILLALTQGMAFQPVAIPAAPAASVVAQSAIETPPATVSSGSAPTAPATAGLQPVPTDPALPNAEALRSEAPAVAHGSGINPVQPTAAVGSGADPIQSPVAVGSGADTAQTPVVGRSPAIATQLQAAVQGGVAIAVEHPEAVVAKVPQSKILVAETATPAVRAAQIVSAAPVETKPVRPAERAKATAISGNVDQPAAPVAAAMAPLALTPAAILGLGAPDLASAAHPLLRDSSALPDVGQAMIEHELDLAQDGEWLDQLARDIARSSASEAPMRFRLNPQTLGHLHVEVAQRDEGVAIRLTVETEGARSIIADAQPRLMAEARAQGVRVAETQVDLAGAREQGAGEHRRHEDGRQSSTIRTVRGPVGDNDEAAPEQLGRSEKYA